MSHFYLDLGLTFLKLGEEARVPLKEFSLKGGARKGLRHTYRKLEKEGCVFELIPADRVPAFLPEFKAISDSWLSQKNTREKGFSLGSFDEDYLKYFPAGIIRKEGRVLAFTNVWQGARKEELSIDLMRYAPDSPPSVMEYLFIHLMLWGKQDGYHWFNLGMAPFSGMESHELAPIWNRLGAFVFRHGGISTICRACAGTKINSTLNGGQNISLPLAASLCHGSLPTSLPSCQEAWKGSLQSESGFSPWLKALAEANPGAYAVNASKAILFKGADLRPVFVDTAFVGLFTPAMMVADILTPRNRLLDTVIPCWYTFF